MYWMEPGGSVWGVRVLLRATVMRHREPGLPCTTLLMSASKGRCPPSCSTTCTPFTHCKEKHTKKWVIGILGSAEHGEGKPGYEEHLGS